MSEEVSAIQYELMIEGKAHRWASDTISVADIRVLGNLPVDAPVIEQDLRDGTERTLSEEEILRPGKLKEGGGLTKKRVNFRKG
jgi:hypothetical protein